MQSIDQEGKTVEEAIEKALAVLNRAKDEVEYEVLDEGSKGVLGVGARPILVRVRAKEIAEMTNIKTLMNGFLTNLGIDFSNMEVNLNKNDIIRISMDTEDAGILIGKHGQTLEALQYIFNQLMHETKYKVMVDVSNYREKQNNKLIETVKKIASSVRQTRRRITLKPMTAFERRMVHETVKEYTDLTTKSIGVEPERRVVISLLNAPEYDPARENTRPERPYRSNSRPQGSGGGGYQGNRPQGGGGGYQGNRPQGQGGGYQGNRPQGGGGYQGQGHSPNYQGNRPQGQGGYQGNNYGNANPGNSSGYNSNPNSNGNTGNYDSGNSSGGYKPRSYNNNSQPGAGYNNSGNSNSGYNNERRNNYSNNNSNQRPYSGYKNDNPNPNAGPNIESNNI